MYKIWLAILTVLLFVHVAFSQDIKPTPKPTPPDDDVVKISTSLIQVDVSVTDNKGKVVTDLKPDEVEIYENGQKQKVTGFSFVSLAKTPPPAEKPAAADKNAIPIPPVELRPDKIRRTFALVVDDLSLSFESAYQTRRALKKFVDEQMQDGDLVAIIRTGAGIGALQGFTSDKRVLYAAIDRVKWNPLGGGGISAFAPIESAPDTSMQTDPSATPDPSAPATTGSGQTLDDFRSIVFATGTLGALRYIVTGMSELPGRKTVILFSDGFKLFETDDSGFQSSGPVMDFLKQLVDLANRSSVVFYTVDARGLQTLGFTAADSITDTSPDAMNAASKSRRDQLLDTQEGLSFLAEETGGYAIKNNNDLAGGVRRVVEDLSYYLVAYEPDSDTFDPAKRKFNKLEVKVLRKGVAVRYRSGFFNVATAAAPKENIKQTPAMQLQNALTSPFAVGGISLRLNALFGNDTVNGSFVHSLLHVDARDLTFVDGKDGGKTAVFDVLAASFGDNGQPVDQIAKTYTFNVTPAGYEKVIREGFVYHFAFPVKKPGAYQYRVAIRDAKSEKVGSASQFIEVPNLKKSRLTLSSIVLENLTADEWRKIDSEDRSKVHVNPLNDTAQRRAKLGSILRYGIQVYNAHLDGGKNAALKVHVRVFRDSKLVLDGQTTPINAAGQKDMQRIGYEGALSLGGKLLPGDYILQIIVTDSLANGKEQTATQFVQFELVG